MRANRKLLALLVLLATLFVLWEASLRRIMYGVPFSCDVKDSEIYINSLCYNYSKHKVAGTLCKPLCVNKQIKIRKCLGHGVKPHVLKAEWKGAKIVLKMEKLRINFKQHMPPMKNNEKFNATTKEIVRYMNQTIYEMIEPTPPSNLLYQVAGEIAKECDIGNDGYFGYREAVICWQLGTTNEYVHLLLLRGNVAMVDLYGACGSLYGVQYAISDEFYTRLAAMPDAKTWKLRSRIVTAVLNMIEALENTPLGTFYLCDMQRSNIGLVRKENGLIMAKAIDADTVMFEEHLLQHVQSKAFNIDHCYKNTQCGYMFCAAKCQKTTNLCTGRLATSNLIIMCKRFVRPIDSLHRDFLGIPSEKYRDELESILERCSQIGNRHSDKTIMKEFKRLFVKSYS